MLKAFQLLQRITGSLVIMSSNYEKKLKITTLCTAFLASMLVTAVSYAGPPTGKLTLSVYEDTPGSRQVLAGKYADAIEHIRKSRVNYQSEYVSTNLCVALIMSGQAEAAKPACDQAIVQAKARMPNSLFQASPADKALLALAYSNRAVLSWLRQQPERAAEDVTRAHALAPNADFVMANWLVYNSRNGAGQNPAIALNRR
jgi:tetratricopeptide (TPR) repeat protein